MGKKAGQIKISQCMIVKNEEQNIRQVLSWGKGVVYEQIVVDTGSTDNTVQIAEEMGAKVYHFEWCDDFSAAKNYAIEQASGDWIAFLDADEYFSERDARRIPGILKKIENMSLKSGRIHIMRAAWMHLDDDGKVFSAGQQDRIFRNIKGLRYKNRVHEVLTLSNSQLPRYSLTDLSIMHTGYMKSISTEKGNRNIPLLKKSVEEDPENYDLWSYLGESYAGSDQAEEAIKSMEHVIEHVAENITAPDASSNTPIKISEDRLFAAFAVWFSAVSFLPDEVISSYEIQAHRYYDIFTKTGKLFPDVEFYMGRFLIRIGKQDEAVHFLELALEKLELYKGSASLKLSGRLDFVYNLLRLCYEQHRDAAKCVYYGTLSLRVNRYQEDTLTALTSLLQGDPNTTAEQAYDFLAKLYNFANIKDKLFVLKASMTLGYSQLGEVIRLNMTDEERAWLDGGKNTEPQ